MTGPLLDGSEETTPCVIWSGSHGAWWRPDGAGYTSALEAAGVFPKVDAMERTRHLMDDKEIVIRPVSTLGLREMALIANLSILHDAEPIFVLEFRRIVAIGQSGPQAGAEWKRFRTDAWPVVGWTDEADAAEWADENGDPGAEWRVVSLYPAKPGQL